MIRRNASSQSTRTTSALFRHILSPKILATRSWARRRGSCGSVILSFCRPWEQVSFLGSSLQNTKAYDSDRNVCKGMAGMYTRLPRR